MLEEGARRALVSLLGSEDWTFRGPPIEIFDASGPLLFQDYLFRSSTRDAWVRLFPGAQNKLVSVEEGAHPAILANLLDIVRQPAIPHHLDDRDLFTFAAARLDVASDPRQDPLYSSNRLYCYHYPNLGVLRSLQGGASVFVDITDNSVLRLAESGIDLSETRSVYSFLQEAEERGEPGPIVVPSATKSLGGTLIGQIKDNWCAAAACQMLLKFYGIDVAQSEIAQRMSIPDGLHNGGAPLENQFSAYNSFFRPDRIASVDQVALAQSCIDELVNDRPVKVGIFQHAQACFGWATVDGSVLYEIFDPMPVGLGKRKWQNPSVIWTMNHIFIDPRVLTARALTRTRDVLITEESGMADGEMSPLKTALVMLVGMPPEAVLAKLGDKLHAAEADLIRKLTLEDIANIKKADVLISKALTESGGGNSCGVYY